MKEKKRTEKKSVFGKYLKRMAFFGVLLFACAVIVFVLYAIFSPEMSVKELTALARSQDKNTKLYYIEKTGDTEIAYELENETLYASQNREWVRYSDMPKNLINAFVAIEDHRFFEHNGIDIRRTAGAILGYITGRSSYGGSGITQQLIKNVTGEDDYSVKRKVREIIRAYKLDRALSKEEILELYLNTIYLSEKSYGVGSAAGAYFDKDVSDLSLTECAALACIPQSPTKWNPYIHPENNERRRGVILSCMEKYGFITEAERAEAEKTPLILSKNGDNGKKNEHVYSWYTESVINESIELLVEKKICTNSQTAAKMIYTGGLKIITAQNPLMQKKAEEYFKNTSNFYKSGLETHPECSIVVIDPKTGGILALVGAVGEKTRNRGLNYATATLRSPGSAIKPLSVYAPALDMGIINYGTVIDDTPVKFVKTSSGGMRPWPGNYPIGYRGLTTVRDAVSRSVNTVAVKILEDVGVKKSYSILHDKMKMTHLVEDMYSDGKRYTDVALSPLALGQLTRGVTVAELTSGYTALCNGGNFVSGHTVLKILDSEGNLLIDNEKKPERIFSPESASIMTRLLQNVTSAGTASVMEMKKQVDCAGKTGTTSSDHDRWFVGYTPDLLAGVWFGYPEPQSLDGYSAIPSPALRAWDAVMREINTEKCLGHPVQKHFSDAEGVVTATYCRDSGKLMSAACGYDLRGSRAETGYFTKDNAPSEYCTCHVFVNYDIVNKGIANPYCPEENIRRVALLRHRREFDYDVKIADAQYTCIPLSGDVLPCGDERYPYYFNMLPSGKFPGRSPSAHQINRYCTCRERYEDEISETLPKTEKSDG